MLTIVLLMTVLAPQLEPILLVPDRYRAEPGGKLTLHAERAELGVAGAATPTTRLMRIAWPAELEGFFWRAAGKQENRDTMPADPGLVLNDADSSLVGMTLESAALEVTGRDLRDLLPPGAAVSASPPEASLRVGVQIERAAKTIVRIGESGASETAISKTTLVVDLRPLLDPTILRAGGDLPLRFYRRGEGVGAAKIVALERDSGTRLETATDEHGGARLTLPRSGAWVVIGWAVRAPDAEHPGWEVAIATLTFAVPDAAAGGGR
jgi:hypothetical protein